VDAAVVARRDHPGRDVEDLGVAHHRLRAEPVDGHLASRGVAHGVQDPSRHGLPVPRRLRGPEVPLPAVAAPHVAVGRRHQHEQPAAPL
jgi:hypothetical protein